MSDIIWASALAVAFGFNIHVENYGTAALCFAVMLINLAMHIKDKA
jgi:hypothetical protein